MSTGIELICVGGLSAAGSIAEEPPPPQALMLTMRAAYPAARNNLGVMIVILT
ncbi:MAG: hypothetical protein ACREV7_14350 [Steroidobacteraceae bacterium]